MTENHKFKEIHGISIKFNEIQQNLQQFATIGHSVLVSSFFSSHKKSPHETEMTFTPCHDILASLSELIIIPSFIIKLIKHSADSTIHYANICQYI